MGDINVDYTPIIRPGVSSQRSFEMNLGGTASNVAVAAARLGIETTYVGKVGDDFMGRFARRELETSGVDTHSLLTDEELFSSHVFVSLLNGERSFSFAVFGSASLNVHPEELDVDEILNTKMLYVAGVNFIDAPIKKATIALLDEALARGVPAVVDMNYRQPLHGTPQAFARSMEEIIPKVRVVKGSAEDFRDIFKTQKLSDVGPALVAKGVELVVMTEDADGASWYFDGEIHSVGAFQAQMIDTTGAGDCFMGALLYDITRRGGLDELSNDSLYEIVRFANAAASICVEGYGAVDPMPYLSEVDERSQQPTKKEMKASA